LRSDRRPLIVVLGPTGVGKSAAAIELALRFGGEIINADSMQVYRGFDIGTAKPSPEDRRRVPHHLLDIIEPAVQFTAADFAARAAEAVRLIMGGEFTFLFWGLVVGIGILLPLSLELYELSPRLLRKGEMRPHSPWLSGVVTASVLLGGFMLRYVVVYAGQMAKIVS